MWTNVWAIASLCLLPALALAKRDLDLQPDGPYSKQILKDFQNSIENEKFNPDWCSSNPLSSKVFLPGSCKVRLISEDLKKGLWYHTIIGNPTSLVAKSGRLQTKQVNNGLKSGFSSQPNSKVTSDSTSSSSHLQIHSRPVPYNDRVAFFIESNKAGKVLDSRVYVFYDTDGFGTRGIKPDYSNFKNLENYIKSVKNYSSGMNFADIVELTEGGGMKLEEKTEYQAIFVTPFNPYDPRSNPPSILASIEFRAGLLLRTSWPDYARIRKVKDSLLFETSVNGGDGTWKTVN